MRRHPPGGGGSRSTGREGGTGEASSSSGRRRLAVHREGAGGWDRGDVVILLAVEARGSPGGRGGSRSTGGRVGPDKCRYNPGGGPGGRVVPGRCHPPGGGG